MSCTGCTSKFSFLIKERSCQLCNFSFCSKCLKKKEGQSGMLNVCERCYANGNVDGDIEIDPPALLIKRLESLENPAKPPVTVFKSDKKLVSLKRGLSVEDQKLVERLEKLKEDKVSTCTVPSESEIKERLKALQGVSSTSENNERLVVSKSKTSQEQVDDLLMEYLEQINLEGSNVDPMDESSDFSRQARHVEETDSENENDAAARLVNRVLEEAALPDTAIEELGLSPPKLSPVEWEPAESELPWCEMCNGDATLRCFGCDGALYCQRCFKQGHDYFELKSHKTVPFKLDSSATAGEG